MIAPTTPASDCGRSAPSSGRRGGWSSTFLHNRFLKSYLQTVTLEQFSGPLDLLLSLIQEEKLDISEVSLSRVTEQFLMALSSMDQERAEEIADFLVIATRLLVIKSRLLLPSFSLPDEEDERSLADQLRRYKDFIDASRLLYRAWGSGRIAQVRHEPPKRSSAFVPPKNFSFDTLRAGMVQLLARISPRNALPETRIAATVTVKQKIEEIRTMLSRNAKTTFGSFIRDAKNRSEIIVGLLALLELVKSFHLVITQDAPFGDILIERI